MELLGRGHLSKMDVAASSPVAYRLPLDEQRIELNPLIGRRIGLHFLGQIHCRECGRKTKKSFNQGFCYPCFRSLACCDSCIVSPEKCHYDAGTCREPEWAEQFCMADHVVYLANSSDVKVGITRHSQVPVRWIDQGATQALPIARTRTRYLAGLLEDALKARLPDKTNWRKMLQGAGQTQDLRAVGAQVVEQFQTNIDDLQNRFGADAVEWVETIDDHGFEFPVLEYPVKIASHNLDKNPVAEGVLQGIKGQYLIMDSGVINIRKFTSYQIEFFAAA